MSNRCLPARPVERPSRLTLPAGAWDCHAHVFGPTARFPYRDVSVYTPPEAPIEEYLALLDIFGFANGVLVQPSTYAFDRACLLDGIAASAGRLKGVAYLTDQDLSPARIASLHGHGLRGVRINAALADFRPEKLRLTAEAIASRGWHISLQVRGIDQVAELAPAIGELPCRLIVEAMGKMPCNQSDDVPGYTALLRLLAAGAVFVKLSHVYKISRAGPPYADATWVPRRLIAANPDAVIFGSDWPHPAVDPMPLDEDLLDLVLDWAPGEAQRHRLFHANPARLYDC